jgi:hypothetical protein
MPISENLWMDSSVYFAYGVWHRPLHAKGKLSIRENTGSTSTGWMSTLPT